VIRQLHDRHRAIEFKKFLQKVDKEVPAELDVHLILDNYSTHKSPAINKSLAAHPRFHLHFTPTSGSWLNLVERWFGELTARKLRRGAHRSVKELNADIEDWTDTWNEDPKPFVWVKTADDILENLAGYCNTINASGHQVFVP
jgi:transposase